MQLMRHPPGATYRVVMNRAAERCTVGNRSVSSRYHGVQIEETDDQHQAGRDPEHMLVAEVVRCAARGPAIDGADGRPAAQRQHEYDDSEPGADVRRAVAGGKQEGAVGNQTQGGTAPREQRPLRLPAGIRCAHRHSENSRPIRPTTAIVAPSIKGSRVTGSAPPRRIAVRFCCQRRKAPAVVTMPAQTRMTPMIRAGQRSGPRSRNWTADSPPA